jgi:hypothetical protein
MFIENKYTNCYNRIIQRARDRKIDGYTETHHVIPESFFKKRSRKGPAGWLDGNPDSPENIVSLTAREHFICHILLPKMTEGVAKGKMAYAAWQMGRRLSKTSHQPSSRIYQMLRHGLSVAYKNVPKTEEHKQNLSKSKKGKPGTPHTTAHKSYMSDRMTEYSKNRDYSGENNPFHGKTHSEESLEHMSKVKVGKNNPNYGVIQLPEWNKAKSDAQIGIAKPILVCENCQQEVGGHGNYKRWHGVNCKKVKVLELT